MYIRVLHFGNSDWYTRIRGAVLRTTDAHVHDIHSSKLLQKDRGKYPPAGMAASTSSWLVSAFNTTKRNFTNLRQRSKRLCYGRLSRQRRAIVQQNFAHQLRTRYTTMPWVATTAARLLCITTDIIASIFYKFEVPF